jgi:low affinity Fe/Cu permease
LRTPWDEPPASACGVLGEIMKEAFRRLSQFSADLVASGPAFLFAIASVIVWLATGPIYHYSDTWQLVINTATSVITFLMVFLIQNTQARDTRAIQLKLDELLRAIKGARNALVRLEDLSDADLDKLREEFTRLAASSKPEVVEQTSQA